jgi:ribosomal protein L40E
LPDSADNGTVTTLSDAARCPACGAAVSAGAPWCTLCWTDLRPKPEPAPEPQPTVPAATAAAVAPAAADSFDPLTAPASLLLADSAVRPEVDVDPLITKAADVVLGTPAWPCQRCGTQVPLELTQCEVCGNSFLGGADAKFALHVPVVGDLVGLSNAGRYGLMAGGVAVITLLLVLGYVILGHIL